MYLTAAAISEEEGTWDSPTGGWSDAHGITQPMSDALVIVHATRRLLRTPRTARYSSKNARSTDWRASSTRRGETLAGNHDHGKLLGSGKAS